MLSYDNNKADANANEIEKYLYEIKEIINEKSKDYRTWNIEPRDKNRECMLQLGFNYRAVKNEILQLNKEDYCEGPVLDTDIKGNVWIFGIFINGKEIYIKLKKVVRGDLRMVRIISFHFSERGLAYPYKRPRRERNGKE